MLAQDQQRNLGRMIAKAWADPAFKERLKADPKAVLAEMGVETPEGVVVEVLENTAEKTHLVLPAEPSCEVPSDEDIAQMESGPISCQGHVPWLTRGTEDPFWPCE